MARTRAVQKAQFMTHLASRFPVMEFMTHFKPLKGDIYIISHFAQREAFLTFSSHPEGTACLLAPQGLRGLWHPLWEPHLFGVITGDTVLLQSQLSLPHPLSEQPQGDPGAEVHPRPWASGTLELIFAPIHCLGRTGSLYLRHCWVKCLGKDLRKSQYWLLFNLLSLKSANS